MNENTNNEYNSNPTHINIQAAFNPTPEVRTESNIKSEFNLVPPNPNDFYLTAINDEGLQREQK